MMNTSSMLTTSKQEIVFKDPHYNNLISMDLDQCTQEIWIGTSKGDILIFNMENRKLKSKIHAVKCPITQLIVETVSSVQKCLLGDAKGNVFLYHNKQVCSTFSLSSAYIVSLTFNHNQNTFMVVDAHGTLACFDMFTCLWKIRLNDLDRSLSHSVLLEEKFIKGVPTMTSIHLNDPYGNQCYYTMVSSGEKGLHLLNGGHPIASIEHGSIVLTGFSLKGETPGQSTVLVSCLDGIIYQLYLRSVENQNTQAHSTSSSGSGSSSSSSSSSTLVLEPYANVGFPITKMFAITLDVDACQDQGYWGCYGYGNEILVYHHDQQYKTLELNNWPQNVQIVKASTLELLLVVEYVDHLAFHHCDLKSMDIDTTN